MASATILSCNPKPSVLPGDVVVPGPELPKFDVPLRPSFLAALRRVLELPDRELCVVRSVEEKSASPFVARTLVAVR